MDLSVLPANIAALLENREPARTAMNYLARPELHTPNCPELTKISTGGMTTATPIEMLNSTNCRECFKGTMLARYVEPVIWLIAADPELNDKSPQRHIVHEDWLDATQEVVSAIAEKVPDLAPLQEPALAGIEIQRARHKAWLQNDSLAGLEILATMVDHYGSPYNWVQPFMDMTNDLVLGRPVNELAVTFDSVGTRTPVVELAAAIRAMHAARPRAVGWIAYVASDPLLDDAYFGTPAHEALNQWMLAPNALLAPATLRPLVKEMDEFVTGSTCEDVEDDPRVLETLRTFLRDGTTLPLALALARAL